MSTSEEQISMAIDTGEVLRIQYHGGSQPGAVREISPKSLKNGKVRAYCYSSKSTKSFLLNKIEVVSNEHEGKKPEWKPISDQSPSYQSLQDFVDQVKGLLDNMGWYVNVNENYLALHRLAKTGKPRPIKSPTIWVEYEEYTYDLIFWGEGGDDGFHKENIRKRKRPWTIRCEYRDTKTFGSLDNLAIVFLEWAKELSPK